MKLQYQEQTVVEILVEEQVEKEYSIVLYNDDVNTFDHVIETLMMVCDHTPEQAEQCAIIVHFNGKCSVKSGGYNELKPACTALLEAGLSAEIH
ncbi:ATP-dependent Clp protease adaptor ClpS [Capnocytophaga canimorsus]|uniref:ATP-dependent Clp protease adapter protein clpS n=1 Tax=Capnocytophaga canimorsus (strain 5) TaxID=860228 RepID=F9YTF5_CAPCC|nr:ATP-dependent Clp protease adaptor ClpS [Capnocytophaga canimorsus]AEK22817.1 ATP-dependent Clp protease adapter protein clpS [Capnocytophaga canimorsus Cc5]WGU67487.1 ATP-dependent Clp protease adaptor ClpS [Capnocytophaga canimorsus]